MPTLAQARPIYLPPIPLEYGDTIQKKKKILETILKESLLKMRMNDINSMVETCQKVEKN